jgi:hypothetical protein
VPMIARAFAEVTSIPLTVPLLIAAFVLLLRRIPTARSAAE